MSAVFEAVADVVEGVTDAVGDVLEVAVDVVEDVGEVVGNVVENALENPVATIATIAAVAAAPATGGASLQFIPAINAANTLAQGGDFDDALRSAAISYVAQGVGNYVGGQLGTAAQYGTDIGSQQTAMLAAQSGDMLGGTFGGTVGGAAGAAAAGATAAALSGGDIDQALINALGNYAVRTGVNYGVNAAGRMVDQFGNEAPPEVQNEILSNADDMRYEVDNMYNRSPENILNPYVDVPTVDPYEVDNVGNVSEENIISGLPSSYDPYEVDNVDNRSQDQILTQDVPEVPVVDPYEVDNVGNVSEENILRGDVPLVDPYEVDNVDNRSEDQILTGTTPDVDIAGAAGRYFQNQFTNALTRQIMGGMMPNRTGGFRPPRSVSLAGLPDVSSSLSDLGFSNLFGSEFTIPEQSDTSPFKPVRMWDPGISTSWDTNDKLGGLGFAGQFINKEESDFVSPEDEERQKILDEVNRRGWMTEDERQILDPNSLYYNPDTIGEADASPWLNTNYAQGGHIDHDPEFYSEGGASLANRYVKGDGDGTSDSVPAMLASGEFVIPADVVSGLGNGDNDAGAKVLDEFMAAIRNHKRSTKPSELPPDSEGPLSYLEKAKKRVGKNGRS